MSVETQQRPIRRMSDYLDTQAPIEAEYPTSEVSIGESGDPPVEVKVRAEHCDESSAKPLPQNLPQPPNFWREMAGLVIRILVIVSVFGLVFTFVYGLHRVSDDEMNPAVKHGDMLMYYRLDKNYDIGDLVLVNWQQQTEVRRVVAKAGDVVDISEDGLLVNGALQQEAHIFQETLRYENAIDFPVSLGLNQVFLLGDARQNATDSRVYGPVDVDDTLGTVVVIMRWRGL